MLVYKVVMSFRVFTFESIRNVMGNGLSDNGEVIQDEIPDMVELLGNCDDDCIYFEGCSLFIFG